MAQIHSGPEDTADMFRRFRAIPNITDNDNIVRSAPLPTGCRVTFKNRLNKDMDQDRLHLSRTDAERFDKVWGVVTSIKPDKTNSPANTDTAMCAQVMLRLTWWDTGSEAYRSVFVRTNAYAAHYTPRRPNKKGCNLRRGDLISGLLQRLWRGPTQHLGVRKKGRYH